MQWGANKGTDVAEEEFVEAMEDDEVVSSTENGNQWIFKPWGAQSSCATWRSAAFARRVSEAKSHELPSGAMRWSVVTPEVG